MQSIYLTPLLFYFSLVLFLKPANGAQEFLWNKLGNSFQPQQFVGHQAFNSWELVSDSGVASASNQGQTFQVCNSDKLGQLETKDASSAVKNYLVSPRIQVPTEASFIQLNYSMDIAKSKSRSSALKVLKFETSNRLTTEVGLSDFVEFDYVNGEFFDMLDGNALLTVPVKEKFVFVAFFDSGYCGSLSIHSLHTNVCPEQQFGSIIMPKRYSGLSRSRVSLDETSAQCAANAEIQNFEEQIVKFCRFDGSWETRTPAERDQEFCVCRPGFYGLEQKDGKIMCTQCATSEIKSESGNSFCRKCPMYSKPNRAHTFCLCNTGFYRANVTNPHYKCYSAPIMPIDIKTEVKFTDVVISWSEPMTLLPQWYSLKCLTCSPQETHMFQAFSSIRRSPVNIPSLAPHTPYTLLLETHSEIVAPNHLRVPSQRISFVTSYKLSVEDAAVSVSNNRIQVTWNPPSTAGSDLLNKLKYKVEVMIDHERAFNSPETEDTSFSYPLPIVDDEEDLPLSIKIGIVSNGSLYWGDEIFASTVRTSPNLLGAGVSRYVMAIGIMLSMLLLVGILVCGVVCMVHRTRSMAKYEQHLWSASRSAPMTSGGYFHVATSASDHQLGYPDFNAVSHYNLNSVHAFAEPSMFDDIFSLAADFCPPLPPNALQIGKRISESVFEGQIFGVLHCQNPTACCVKLLASDAPSSMEDKIAKRRFLVEAATMAQFHHCNVQKLHGLVYSAESPYMEMATELCTRGSLKQSLIETPFWANSQQSTVFFLLRGIVHGMEYLHDLGYVHKVLRSQNVMITQNNVAKVAGFEERAYLEESDTATALDELDLVPWQPSEVIKHNNFGPAADVYSFGTLFWEVIHDCRLRPFNLDSSKEVAIKTCEGKRPPIPKEVPQWVETMISSCWVDDIFRRPVFSVIRQQIDSLIINNSLPHSKKSSQEDILSQSFYVDPSRFSAMQASPFSDFDVAKWLQSLKLEKLLPLFEKRGISTFEQVSMLKEADFSSMGEISSKQRKKMLNSISQFNTKQPISPSSTGIILSDKMASFTEHGV